MSYRLPPFVGYCSIGARTILLDARNDRYWMVPADLAFGLDAARAGQPGLAGLAALQVLARAGFVRDDHAGVPVAPCEIVPARTSCLDAPLQDGWLQSLAARRAFRATERGLRRHGLASMLEHLLRMRDQQARAAPRRYMDAATGFARLRTWLSPLGRCLPLSLALATRCADAEVCLVFGVKLDPFAAHAWVQHGDIVLNDDVHVVAQFTPILVV